MQDKQKESSFDSRIIARHIASGRLDPKEAEAHLAELEDCSEEADWTTTRMSMPPKAEEEEA